MPGVLLLSGVVSLLLAACATTPTVTPERRAQISAAAQACQREHPTVERYSVNQFGYITATYRNVQGQAAGTDPFFACVQTRLGGQPAPAPTPAVTPAPSGPPSRTADRLKDLETLRQQRLITEEEYQATRKRILEGL